MPNTISLLLRRKTAILVLTLFLLAATHVSAAVIQLISGKIIEGEVVERNDDLIKVDTGKGYSFTYFMDEISTINGEPVASVVGEEEKLKAVEPVETIEQLEEKHVEVTEPVEAVDPPVEEELAEAEISPIKDIVHDEIQELTEGLHAPAPTVGMAAPVLTPEKIAVEPHPVKGETVFPVLPDGDTLSEGPPTEVRVPSRRVDEPKALDPVTAVMVAKQGGERGIKKETENIFFRTIDRYKDRVTEQKARFQQKLPFIRERLEQIPVKVRRNILTVILLLITAVYVLVCFPFMIIAKKLGKRHIWLTWIPIVHQFYLVYMAGRPLWWIVFYIVPIVSFFIPLVLFIDILKALRKPSWLVIPAIIPGVNLFMLWYLAIIRINEDPPSLGGKVHPYEQKSKTV